MEEDTKQLKESQLKWIGDNKIKVERHLNRLRRRNTQTIITGLFASTFATVLAGYTAASNAPLMNWRWTCALVAVFTLCATISTGIHKQFDISGNLSKASACVGRLAALDLSARLGTRTNKEISQECEELAALYPDFIS